MADLHLLGTGGAVTSSDRTTTMLAITSGERLLVVDCGGDVVHRLMAHGLDPVAMDALVITHEHPDHVAGFPLMMEKIWLMGRTAPLPVHGIPEALDQAARCMAAFNTAGWSLPEIAWRPHEPVNADPVRMAEVFDVRTAPGVHGVPVTGLDIRVAGTTSRMTYSCDTEPCDAITALATGTDLLVHEANGQGRGHASLLEAASVAALAGARRMVAVHLPSDPPADELDAAERVFGAITVGRDGLMMSF